MGYTTTFDGSFQLDHPLTEAQRNYLKAFARTRRMRRDAARTEQRPDPVRQAVALPVGPEGGYFVGEGGFRGQGEGGFGVHPEDVLDYNNPPQGQPGLWCQWVPTEDGQAIKWDENEKFYHYVEWLEYLIQHFLQPWGYVLNGQASWQGEEPGDCGVLHVRNNQVKAVEDVIIHPEPDWDS